MLRTLRVATLAALATTAVLAVASPASAVTPAEQARTVTVRVSVVYGDRSWNLAARYCGRGELYRTMTVRSPQGQLRDLARIWPRDIAIIPCTRPGRVATSPTPIRQVAVSARRTTATGWTHPLPGATLTQCYRGSAHAGLDMSRSWGTPIRAAAAGRVMAAGWIHGGYGISVMIDNGRGVKTHYGHMSVALVRAGQWVRAGQTIGRVGNTGDVRSSNYNQPHPGSHLHFEVRLGAGTWPPSTDPASWLRRHGVRSGC